jgi:sec-independent protein translocase protein TatA
MASPAEGGGKMFRDFGPVEIGLILLIILIVFGAGKLPQVGSALGKTIREFRKASRDDDDDKRATDVKSEAQPNEKTTKN